LGIAAEARIAEELGIAKPPTTARQIALLDAVGLPVTGLGAAPAAVVEALGRDKKARDGQVPFVLAPEIGAFRLVRDVPRATVLPTSDPPPAPASPRWPAPWFAGGGKATYKLVMAPPAPRAGGDAQDDIAALSSIKRYEERLARDPGSLAFAPLADLYRK